MSGLKGQLERWLDGGANLIVVVIVGAGLLMTVGMVGFLLYLWVLDLFGKL